MRASSKQPEFRELLFIENQSRPGIFDLSGSIPFKKFKYFRLEQPKAEFLIKQGARYVLESWSNERIKILFTGLIPLTGLWYWGDHRDALGRSIVVCRMESGKIVMYYFNGFSKKSAQMTRTFVSDFIRRIEKGAGNQPAPHLSSTQTDSLELPFIPQR